MIIADLRTFTTTTFSNYKTTAVRKELVNVLLKSDMEAAAYWTAELVSSGHFEELWDVLFLFYAKYIHIANVKIAFRTANGAPQAKDGKAQASTKPGLGVEPIMKVLGKPLYEVK